MDDKKSKQLAELIAERNLNPETIGRVMRLFSSGQDVLSYLRKDYNDAQLQEILTGLEDGCDVSFYDNTKLSPSQMKAIRLGISHIPMNQDGEQTEPNFASIDEQSKESQGKPSSTIVNNPDLTKTEDGSSTNEQQTSGTSEPAETDDKSGSSVTGIIGKLIGCALVACFFLLPRLCNQRIEKKNMELVQDLKDRGLVIKDGDIKFEPKLMVAYSGDLSLEHTQDWEAATGDAGGYGCQIDLSHNSSYVAAIQVAAFNNPNHVSLSSAVNLSKKQISSIFEGIPATTGKVQDYDLNGTPAKVFSYKLSAAGEENMNRRCITSVMGNYIVLINEAFENYNDKDFNDIFGSIERSIKIKTGNTQVTSGNEKTKTSTQVSSQKASSKDMTISQEKVSIGIGQTLTLKAYNYGSRLKWESDNTDIATISQGGVVRGLSRGSTLVWAIGDGETYLCCEVEVK